MIFRTKELVRAYIIGYWLLSLEAKSQSKSAVTDISSVSNYSVVLHFFRYTQKAKKKVWQKLVIYFDLKQDCRYCLLIKIIW